jgi:hypothetical protein
LKGFTMLKASSRNSRTLRAADMRRAALSLASRATWLERRREPDPLIRAAARREAEHCRRIAAKLLAALVEVSR